MENDGAPQFAWTFLSASPPNVAHSIRIAMISLREVTPRLSSSCTDSLQTRSGVIFSRQNFSAKSPRFTFFNTDDIELAMVETWLLHENTESKWRRVTRRLGFYDSRDTLWVYHHKVCCRANIHRITKF